MWTDITGIFELATASAIATEVCAYPPALMTIPEKLFISAS
jgi:hypothetical protein